MNVASPARWIGWITVVAATGLVTACGTSAAPPSSAQGPSSAPPTAPTTGASQSASPTPAAQPAVAGPGTCTTGDLHLAVGQSNGAAGSIYYALLLTNISTATCTLYGYPGVAFVSAPGGKEIGGPAVRNPTFPKQLVTLAPGATAHASLQVVIAANYPASLCKPVTAHWLQVFPPSEYAALDVAFTAQTCTGKIPSGSTLGIYVVRPGTTGP